MKTDKMVDVLWLQDHPRYAYNTGDLGTVQKSELNALLEGEYVKVVSPEEIEKILKEHEARQPRTPEENEFVRVEFLEYHPAYAYKPGDIGIVHNSKLDMLIEGEYVRLTSNK